MPILTANFEITLPAPIYVQASDISALHFQGDVNGFCVAVRIMDQVASPTPVMAQSPLGRIDQIRVEVSRDDPESPPPIGDVEKNYIPRADWFQKRNWQYQTAAVVTVNRLMLYFRYVLRMPGIRFFDYCDRQFLNPVWTDACGSPIEYCTVNVLVDSTAAPGMLGMKPLTAADLPALVAAVRSWPMPPPTSAQEFLSDAQTAIVDGNYRRAVLEMAIACEVAIKQAFFATATPAGAAFEYLEDRSRISVRPIDLLDGPAFEAFGESFKKRSPDEYQEIDYLFRCRNKIAHRALAEYRDDGGTKHIADYAKLGTWWAAVEGLFDWLKAHTGRDP
jgi:hypothetical protein